MFNNNISRIIDKISNRLGIELLMDKLPRNIDKYKWVDIIQNEVLDLYSRAYPHLIKYDFNPTRDYNPKTGTYTVNKEFLDKSSIVLLGVKGFSKEQRSTGLFPSGLIYDRYANNNLYPDCCSGYNGGIDTSLNLSMAMTQMSYFKDPLIVDFYPPNSFRITNIDYTDMLNNRIVEIELLTIHPKSLFTLSQTQLTLFENLATAKIAEFLYGNLKYYEGIESGYQAIDLKLDTIQEWMGRSEDIINQIYETFVSLSNKNQDLFYII